MYIKNIRIDGYGPWSDLCLEGLSEGLNVFFGPPGSGKSLLRRCIRAILTGFGEAAAPPHAAGTHPVEGGTLTTVGAAGRIDISRYQDGTRQGRLLLRSPDGTAHDPSLLATLRQLPPPTFATLLDVDFQSRPSLRQLLQTLAGAGLLEPAADGFRAPLEAAEAERAARELQAARRRLQDHDALQDAAAQGRRRAELLADIERLSDQLAARRSGQDGAKRTLLVEIEREEAEARRLRGALKEHDAREPQPEPPAISRPLPSPPPAGERDGVTNTARLRQQLETLDEQVRRWRRVEADVQRRRETLRDELTQWEMNHARSAGPKKSPRARLGLLEQHLSQLEQELERLDHDASFGCVCRATLDSAGPLTRKLREQLYGLCQELTHQQRQLQREAIVNELKQLRRCRLELAEHLRRLTQRRQDLLTRYGRLDESGLERYRRVEGEACECHEHEAFLEGERPIASGLPSAAWEAGERQSRQAAHEARRAAWLRRRHELRAELAEVEGRLDRLRRKLPEMRPESSTSELSATLAALRGELEALESSRESGQRERLQLQERVRHWEAIVARTPARPAEGSDLLERAAEYLRSISGGKYVELSGSGPEGLVWVTSHDGQVYPHDVLGPPTYDQVYLSLQLAASAVYARRGIRIPLILDDPFLHLDVRQQPEVLDVLSDFARHETQLLLFTGDPVAARLLSERDHWVRDLPAAKPVERPGTRGGTVSGGPTERRSADNGAAAESRGAGTGRRSILLRSDWDPEEFPGELADRVVVEQRAARQADEERRRRDAAAFVERPWGHSRRYLQELLEEEPAVERERPAVRGGNGDGAAHWKFYLETASPIEDAPSIGRRMAEQLRGIGVTQVSDLLALSPKTAASQLAHMTVPSETIRAWQAQAWLVCCVPHLRPYDARILVACGITDPDQLQEMEPRDLLMRVERFLATREGRRMVQSGNDYELARITQWIRMAREARRRWERNRARQRRTRSTPSNRPFAPRAGVDADTNGPAANSLESPFVSGLGHGEGTGGVRHPANGPRTESAPERVHDANGSNGSNGRQHSPADDHADSRPRLWQERSANGRGETTPTHSADGSAASETDADAEWKFYLHMSSPVVDAPAIGPVTAERLESIGIETVADLLNADPREAAERLDYHRIKPDTIRLWQALAGLVCRIPHLRGHDAQILVACGYTEPEQLQSLTVDELYAVVAPFVETREGERIIRSGRRPDREEVADWLRWARHTRPLRAA